MRNAISYDFSHGSHPCFLPLQFYSERQCKVLSGIMVVGVKLEKTSLPVIVLQSHNGLQVETGNVSYV